MGSKGEEAAVDAHRTLDAATPAARVTELLDRAWRIRRRDLAEADALTGAVLTWTEAHPAERAIRCGALAIRSGIDRRLGRSEAAAASAQESEALLDDDARARKRALVDYAAARILLDQGATDEAERRLREALERPEGLRPDAELRALLQGALATVCFRRGRGEEAETEARAAVAHATETGDASLEGRARWILAEQQFALGKNDNSRKEAERALACARASGDVQLQANALRLLGNVAGRSTAHGAALEYMEQAARLERQHGIRRGLANTLNLLAMEHLSGGMHERAAETLTEAVAIWRAEGVRPGLALALYCQACAAETVGDHERALVLVEESTAIFRETGDRHELAGVLGVLARLRLAAGDEAGALAVLDEQIELARAVGREDCLTLGLASKASLCAEREEHDAADVCIREALGLADRRGEHELLADTHGKAAEVAEARGDLAAAVQHLRQQVQVGEEAARDLMRARAGSERARLASEQRLARAFRNTPDSITITRLEDGFIHDVNHSFTRLFGWAAEEAIGRKTPELGIWSNPEDRERFRRELESTGRVRELQAEGMKKSGEKLDCEVSAEVMEIGGELCALTLARDVTARNEVERALAESEARYRSVVEDQTEFIVRHEPGGILTFVNEAYCRYFGYRAEELIGTSFYRLIPDEADRELVRRKFEGLTPENPVAQSEHVVTAASGERRRNEWTDRASFDEEGQVIDYQSVGRDVTERRRAQDALRAALEEVRRLRDRLQEENIYLREEIRDAYDAQEIVGSSTAIQELKGTIRRVARTDATILITGETGTGKELVVRALHEASPRRRRPLIKVNCAAVAAGLVESELFGHERGAFTGAVQQRKGRFELADGGSLFLDEVGELSDEVQAKLLRVLEEGEFERVGSSRVIRTDVRVFAATNRDLERAVADGRFRSDLFYRLNVFPIDVPPLRERDDDAAELAVHFLQLYTKRFGRDLPGFEDEALAWIRAYAWPGNVRELRNLVERAAIAAEGPLLARRDFGLVQREAARREASDATLDAVQRRHVERVLEQTDWVIQGPKGAARILGMRASTLRSRMERLGIRKPDGPSR